MITNHSPEEIKDHSFLKRLRNIMKNVGTVAVNICIANYNVHNKKDSDDEVDSLLRAPFSLSSIFIVSRRVHDLSSRLNNPTRSVPSRGLIKSRS